MVNLRIIKRKGKEYFYLEHTIRDGNKFKNQREYLGTKKPENIEEIKEKFILKFLEGSNKSDLENIKKKFKKEFLSYPKTAKENYIESFMIKFTYNSNRIEGNTLTLKETADLLQEHLSPKNKSIKDAKEAEYHKDVFYEMLNHEKELNLAVVLNWHKKLFEGVDKEIAGTIRKHPVAIARSKVELPLPVELEILLHEFFIWYKKNKDKFNPVIFAALVHLRFVTIHPFTDGNGRISRLMMNFVLKKQGYPMVNIEYINRVSYYNALERSQTTGKENIFIQYLIKRYLKAYKNYI